MTNVFTIIETNKYGDKNDSNCLNRFPIAIRLILNFSVSPFINISKKQEFYELSAFTTAPAPHLQRLADIRFHPLDQSQQFLMV